QVVFAQSGDVASNASVATGAVEGAKATGDLDSDLHHAESPFGLVVGKGQLQCPQESENGLFVALQTIQQVLSFGLLAAFHGPLLKREGIALRPARRMRRYCFCQQRYCFWVGGAS